ncbi:hypothetical protein ABBQ32_002088 [Trebouxia sp. C0010 RCD-2024]
MLLFTGLLLLLCLHLHRRLLFQRLAEDIDGLGNDSRSFVFAAATVVSCQIIPQPSWLACSTLGCCMNTYSISHVYNPRMQPAYFPKGCLDLPSQVSVFRVRVLFLISNQTNFNHGTAFLLVSTCHSASVSPACVKCYTRMSTLCEFHHMTSWQLLHDHGYFCESDV